MSGSSGNDLLSAALRHQRDAERLATVAPRSLDQARHLFGFGPECARKALLDPWQALEGELRRALNQAIGHGFGPHEEVMVTWALALNPAARALVVPGGASGELLAQGFGERHPSLRGWNPECRYEPSGSAKEAALRTLRDDAREAVDAAAEALWLQGVGSGDPR